MADKESELSKVQKQQAKEQREAAKEIAASSRKIAEATSDVSDGFKNIINGLQEVNADLALSFAELRKTSKDTLAGALQSRKNSLFTANITALQTAESLEVFQAIGGDLDLLKTVFEKYGDTDFDFSSFAKAQAQIKESNQKVFEVQLAIAAQADRLNYLTEEQKINNKATSDFIKEQTAFLKLDPSSSLEDVQKKLDENLKVYQDYIGVGLVSKQDADDAFAAIDKNRAIYKELLAIQSDNTFIQQEISNITKSGLEKQLVLAEETQNEALKLSSELNDRVTKVSDQLQKDSNPIGEFADGLKTLTDGIIDLEGVFDSVTKYANAIGKIFGKKDLMGSIVSATQNFFATNPIIQKASLMFKSALLGLGTMFTSLAKGFVTVVKSLATGATSLMAVLAKGAAGMQMVAKGLGRALIMFIPAALAFVTGLLTTAAGMLVAALPYIAIAAAVIALGYAVYKAAEWIEEKTGFFSALWSGISTFFSTAIGGLFDFFGGIGTFFYGLFTLDFGMMWEGLKQTFGGFWDVITSPLQGLFDFFSELFNFDIVGYFKNKVKDLPLVGSLFGGDEERDAQKELADNSGILTRDWGMDTIDTSMVGRASDEQIQAILDTADVSPDDRRTLEGVLADRAAIRAADDQQLAYQQEATTRAQAAADESGRSTAPYIITNAQSTNNSTSNVYPAAPQTRNYDRYGATIPSTQFVY